MSSNLEPYPQTLPLIRVIPEEEYVVWAVRHEAAQKTMADRALALDAAAEAIERDLLLLGATAIEDKLQDVRPGTCCRPTKTPLSMPYLDKELHCSGRHDVLQGIPRVGTLRDLYRPVQDTPCTLRRYDTPLSV